MSASVGWCRCYTGYNFFPKYGWCSFMNLLKCFCWQKVPKYFEIIHPIQINNFNGHLEIFHFTFTIKCIRRLVLVGSVSICCMQCLVMVCSISTCCVVWFSAKNGFISSMAVFGWEGLSLFDRSSLFGDRVGQYGEIGSCDTNFGDRFFSVVSKTFRG